MIPLNVGPVPPVLAGNEEPWGIEYEEAVNAGKKPLHRYRSDQVRDALRLETSGKCAYCESYIEHVSYSHVEHIKPKAKFPRLVCMWNNLTLACQKCNTNKGDYYEDDARLLNPYLDDVEEQVVFFGPMAIDFSDRAKLTINRISLNRPELLYKRSEKLSSVKLLIDLMGRAGDNVALTEALKLDLEEALAPNAEFCSCSRYFHRSIEDHGEWN